MAIFSNPMIPAFERLKVVASGIGHEGQAGTYTAAAFLAAFPQFKNTQGTSLVPDTMLNTFVAMANASIFPDAWGNVYELAAGLYVAHHCALYLSTYNGNGSASAAQAAGNAENAGLVKSATMGDTSVTYDNSAVTSGTEKWGTWNATKYGAQLITMARGLGIAGTYVI